MNSVVVLITCCIITTLLPVQAIKINIATEECFTEKVNEPSTTLAGSFVAMLPQGILATQRQYDLTIYDPQGGKVYEALDKLDDSFSIVATSVGVYKFCLIVSDYRKNQRRWHSYRQVHWELTVGHTVHHDKASDDDLEKLWATVEQLDRSLQEMVAEQDYFKNREARHRRMVSVGQLLLIRRMFSGPLSGAKGGLPQYIF